LVQVKQCTGRTEHDGRIFGLAEAIEGKQSSELGANDGSRTHLFGQTRRPYPDFIGRTCSGQLWVLDASFAAAPEEPTGMMP
jgi:hypothetical protein